MKLFLKLLIPWFWKSRELSDWGTIPPAWVTVLVRIQGSRAASTPVEVETGGGGGCVGISENEQHTFPTSESRFRSRLGKQGFCCCKKTQRTNPPHLTSVLVPGL